MVSPFDASSYTNGIKCYTKNVIIMIIKWYIEEKINKLLLMYQQIRGNLPLSNTSQDALAISDIMMLSLPYFSLFNWKMKIYYVTNLFKRLFCIFNHPRLRNSGIISINTVISFIDSGIRNTQMNFRDT